MTTTTLDRLDMTDPSTRLAARRYVAGAKTRINDDWRSLVAIANALDGPTKAVAVDDLTDTLADMVSDLKMVTTDADSCTICGAWATAISTTGSDNYCPDHTPSTGVTPL